MAEACMAGSVYVLALNSCARNLSPLTLDDSSEARYTKTAVTVSGLAHSDESPCGSDALFMLVSISPGSTLLTRTPVPSNSAAQVRVSWSRADFETPYAPQVA